MYDNITNFSHGEAKRRQILAGFGVGASNVIQKGAGQPINKNKLVLKDVAVNGKMQKRWVDPTKGDVEHAPHGSQADFEHEGTKMKGTVGRVSKSSGKYIVKDDAGNEYKKHPHELNVKTADGAVKDTNSPHHQLARKRSDDVLKRYTSLPNAKPEFKAAAHDVLAERAQQKTGGNTNTDKNAKPSSNGQKKDDNAGTGTQDATDKGQKVQPQQKQAQKTVTDIEDDNNKSTKDLEEESEADSALDTEERFKDFSDYVKGVIQGKKKSAIMYGSGGVGKTFTTKVQLEKQFGKNRQYDPDTMQAGTDDYDYVFMDGGKTTSTGFWKTMYQHNGKVIVYDDCDSALEDKDIKGFLKGALGSGQGQVSNSSGKAIKTDDGTVIPQQFNFNGKMIFISNLPKDKILDKDLQPVMSRSYAMDMTMNRKQTMAYIKHIATDKKTGELTNMKFDGLKYNHDEMKHVVNYLDKHKEHAFDLNARTVETLLGTYQLSKERAEEDALNSGKQLSAKEMEDATMKNFDRKAINYLYQHKIENGKVDKKYIAKSLVDVLGCTIAEARAWHALGMFSYEKFFNVKLEKGLQDLLTY